MILADSTDDAVDKDNLDANLAAASLDLYHLLLSMTSGSALDKVVNAGEGEGGLAWRSITNRWEPKLRTRQA
eukprot:1435516-Karenia_brevis.AAC.1